MSSAILKDKIRQFSKDYLNDVISIRRHIHMYPELSFQELKTCEYVWNQLEEIGITDKHKLANTGIVAHIKGRNPEKKTIALRADMDALPITEANDVSYKSTNKGVMHACGHDLHMAIALGILKNISENPIKPPARPATKMAINATIRANTDGRAERGRTSTLSVSVSVSVYLDIS